LINFAVRLLKICFWLYLKGCTVLPQGTQEVKVMAVLGSLSFFCFRSKCYTEMLGGFTTCPDFSGRKTYMSLYFL